MRFKKRSIRWTVLNFVGLVWLFLSGCNSLSTSNEARNVEVHMINHAQVWSRGNVDLIPTLYAADYVGHFPGGERVVGRDGIRASVERHRTAFPDWTETVEQVIAEGDWVVTLFRSTGTHRGMFLGRQGTGNKVEILETCVFRMVDGQIAEQWTFPDIASLQNQIASR
jgi:steroid delta-isomerase-like uncharacterized protein